MIYIRDLYQDVLKKNMTDSHHLDVISGYVSSVFLEQILEEFPEVSLNIYVGMALEGISLNEHKSYIQLSNLYEDQVKIYYQIETPLTHAKIYSFRKNNATKVTYAGSANFSQNGFKEYQEILVKLRQPLDHLFVEAGEKSLECRHPDIHQYISFFGEEDEPVSDESGRVREEPEPLGTNKNSQSVPMSDISRRLYRKVLKKPEMVIPILPENVSSMSDRGINARFRNQDPYLIESNNYPFANYFPTETVFNVVTDSGKEFKCHLSKQDYSRLIFEPSLYDYLRTRLGVREERPLTHGDIKKMGDNLIYVSKKDENTYYFNFFLKNN